MRIIGRKRVLPFHSIYCLADCLSLFNRRERTRPVTENRKATKNAVFTPLRKFNGSAVPVPEADIVIKEIINVRPSDPPNWLAWH